MRGLFLGWFWTLLDWAVLLEVAGQYWKLARAKNQTTIGKFSLPTFVKRPVSLSLFKHNTPFRTFFIEALNRLSKVSNVLHLIELQTCSNALKNLTAFQRKLFSEKKLQKFVWVRGESYHSRTFPVLVCFH